MQVDVVDNPRAGDATEVPADVVALRRERVRQRAHGGRRQPVHLEGFLISQLGVLGDVPVRGDHQVAGRVRVLVQQAERLLAPVDDEALRLRCSGGPAEDAALILVRAGDVFEPPRSPQLFMSLRLRHTPRRGRLRVDGQHPRDAHVSADIAASIGVEERELDEISSGYVPDEEIGDRLRALAASGASVRVARIPTKAIVIFVIADAVFFAALAVFLVVK